MQPVPAEATQIHTASEILDMTWTLEKTGGTLSLFTQTDRESSPKSSRTSTHIYYSGALFTLELEHFLMIRSLTNFSFLRRPEGIAWSEYQYHIEDLCVAEIEEHVGYPVPVAYKSDILPFVGYSFLDLNYKNGYHILPGDTGSNTYHTLIMGMEYGTSITRQLRAEAFAFSSLQPYGNLLSSTKSYYFGYGGSLVFDSAYLGTRLFFSFRRNRESDTDDSLSITKLHEVGLTFRISG